MPGPRSITAMLAGLATALCAALGTSARAEDALGTGTYLASASRVTTKIDSPFPSIEDKDLFIFDGFAGQTVSVTVTIPKGKAGSLIPFVELFRPDQSPVTVAEGAKFSPKPGPSLTRPRTVKITYKLNQTGVWTIRVRGGFPGKKFRVDADNPRTPNVVETSYTYIGYDPAAKRTKGEYTIAVSYAKAPKSTKRNAVPGPDGLYRFIVPAAGGAQLNGSLTYKGGMPTFDKVFDSTGADLLVSSSFATKVRGKNIVALKSVPLPAKSPAGAFIVTFRAPDGTPATGVNFTATIKVVKPEKPLKTRLAVGEPSIEGLDRTEGGPGVSVTLTCLGITDPAKRTGKPRVFLDRIEMKVTKVSVQGTFTYITFVTPSSSVDFPDGVYDVRVTSSTGQAATRVDAFAVVPSPVIESLDPISASEAGNFLVTIRGSNFSTASPYAMRIRYVGKDDPTVRVTATIPMQQPLSSTVLRYTHPLKSAQFNLGSGEFYVEVENYATGRWARAPYTITLADAATISRVTPGLIPILGGETIYVKGANFRDTDHVFLERTPNSPLPIDDADYEDVTAVATTFVDAGLHKFVAPARAKGTYRVFVRDTANGFTTPTRAFSYYQLSDFTTDMGLDGADGYDAYSTALGDFDPANPKVASPSDRVDLFLSRRGGASLGTTSQTRVFRNDGDGSFTDVTASVMPAPTADDDWRADKVVVADIDLDGYSDLVLATNSDTYPAKNAKSHVRILLNQTKGGGASATERVFRDATADLMAPMRKLSILYGGSGKNDVDDWRAQDMFVGDIDFSNKSPPEIVIVNDEVFENYYVSCTPYCASPYASGYTYSFYFGGLRVMKWDQSARSGLGRYKYDANYFPRKGGITVPIFNPPPGVTVPTCKPNECRGKFTPFTGQRLAVGDINYDPATAATAKPDFAVINSGTVTRNGATISSLQVALNQVGTDGSNVTDVTDKFAALDGTGNYFRSDAVAIGHPAFEAQEFGVIAVARADLPASGSASALRVLRYKKSVVPNDPGTFEDITTAVLPPTTATDRFQSSRISFLDVDGDGDEDMVTVARAAPGGDGPALRIFRNDIAPAPNYMTYTDTLKGLIVGVPAESIPGLPLDVRGWYSGESLAIGDLDGDGAVEFVVTRSTPGGGTGPNTRAIRTDK